MSVENITIARPYAEAAYAYAKEQNRLEFWSNSLALLKALACDPQLDSFLDSPAMGKDQRVDLLLDLMGKEADEPIQNLIRILVENNRLSLLPEIESAFDERKQADEGCIDVHIQSAYAVNDKQTKQLATLLKAKLGKDVKITAEKDPKLIGGVRIRAGDLIIDASLRNKLDRLASEFRI
jgi:F-type H+-transporting ATPase subunit delta